MDIEIKRFHPCNYKIEDRNLFEHEFSFIAQPPKINTKEWVLIDGKGYNCNPGKLTLTSYISTLRRKHVSFKEAIWITDQWSSNYFHWLTETSQKLTLLKNHEIDSFTILIHHSIYSIPFIEQFFTNTPKKYNLKVIKGYEVIICKKLLIPQLNIPSGQYNIELLNGFSFFCNNRNLYPQKRVFINRKSNVNRSIINFDVIEPILKKYNFDIVYAEELSYHQQYELFSQTQVLIGIHGAGLTNMLWMQPNTTLLEIRRKNDNHNNCYFALSSARKINYYYLLCEVDDYSKNTQQNNFMIEPIYFNNTIETILSH